MNRGEEVLDVKCKRITAQEDSERMERKDCSEGIRRGIWTQWDKCDKRHLAGYIHDEACCAVHSAERAFKDLSHTHT